jgi:hypothetical protein
MNAKYNAKDTHVSYIKLNRKKCMSDIKKNIQSVTNLPINNVMVLSSALFGEIITISQEGYQPLAEIKSKGFNNQRILAGLRVATLSVGA